MTLILNEYRSICELGFDPVVVIQTSSTDLRRPVIIGALRESCFCYRIGRPLEIRIQLHDRSTGIYLAETHR